MSKGFFGAMPFFGREAGAVLNSKNRTAITLAYRQLKTALKNAGVDPDSDEDETASDAKPAREASAIDANEAAGFAMADLSTLIDQALNVDVSADEYHRRRRIADLYDDRLIYQENWSGPFYAVTYSVSEDGNVSFGTPELVVRKVDYISPGASQLEASEAGELSLTGDIVPLIEAAVTETGQTRIKLIAPGWGSSGYYPADVLRRDGPNVFKAGTKMFWDHPTAAEEAARPEGSLDRWAATLVEDARFDVNGPKGAGLYALADVRSDFHRPINDLAPKGLGVSIRASGKARVATVDGKSGPVVEAITSARSVDFVTTPGAGGAVVALFEAARKGDPVVFSEAGDPANIEGVNAMPFNEADRAAIAEMITAAVTAAVTPLQESNARLRDAADLREAERIVRGRLAAMRLPSRVKDRIAPEIARCFERDSATGAIDAGKLVEATNQRAATEVAELRALGVPGFTGKIEGFGDSSALTEAGSNDATGDDMEKRFAEIFTGWGLSKEAAEVAARGRGR